MLKHQNLFNKPYNILFLIVEQINKQVCVSVAGSVDKISMIALSIDQAYNCLIHFYTVQSVYTGPVVAQYMCTHSHGHKLPEIEQELG